MQLSFLTKGYWPLPPLQNIYANGKWAKLTPAKNGKNRKKNAKNPFGAKFANFTVSSQGFSGLIIAEAKLGKALSKKIYFIVGKKKILLSRWIGGLYSNCNTCSISQVREFYNAIASHYSYHTEPERKAQLSTIASTLPKNSLADRGCAEALRIEAAENAPPHLQRGSFRLKPAPLHKLRASARSRPLVLDASAGTCTFAEVAKKHGLRTVCMDLSAKMLAQRKDKRTYAIVSSAATAPFPPCSFDAIVHLFSNLLAYDKKLFPKFRTLLRSNGILIYHPVKSPGEQWLPNWREKTMQRLKHAGFSRVTLRSIPSSGKKKSILTFFWAQK